MKIVKLFMVIISLLVVRANSQDKGLDLSKVLDTLYNKVEANMIKTIRKNLGGKNSLIKPKEKVNCKKRKFALNPKCIKFSLSNRMRRLEKNIKKMQPNIETNALKDFAKYKKKVNQLVFNTTDTWSITKNNTDQINKNRVETKVLDDKVKEFDEKLNQVENVFTNTSQLLNITLAKLSQEYLNLSAVIVKNDALLGQVVDLVTNLNNTVVNQANTIQRQAEQIEDLQNILNNTRITTTPRTG